MKLVLKSSLAILVITIISHLTLSARTLDTLYHKEELLSINGTQIYVKVMGQGEPLLIVHGGPGLSHDYFLPHLKPLAENHQLIFYDQRGTGRSSVDLDSASMTLDLFVEDIEAIRKHFKLDKLNIVGHSWGGFISSLYAIKYPKKVRSLVLIASSPMNSHLRDVMIVKQKSAVTQEDLKSMRTITKSKEFAAGDPVTIKRLFWAIYKPSFFAQKLVYKLPFYFNENYPKSQQLLIYMNHSMVKYDYYNQLNVVKAPALIVQGENDPTPIETAQEFNRQLKNSEIFIIPQCGHFPFVEKPEVLFKKMESFYSGLNPK